MPRTFLLKDSISLIDSRLKIQYFHSSQAFILKVVRNFIFMYIRLMHKFCLVISSYKQFSKIITSTIPLVLFIAHEEILNKD